MSMNTDYKIKNVAVSTNGRNEIYFDVEWEGDENLEYFELRIREGGTDNSLELYNNSLLMCRISVKDFNFINDWKSKHVNKQIINIELGIYDYDDDGKLIGSEVLAAYKPIELNIYYEFHIFRKNVLEIR